MTNLYSFGLLTFQKIEKNVLIPQEEYSARLAMHQLTFPQNYFNCSDCINSIETNHLHFHGRLFVHFSDR